MDLETAKTMTSLAGNPVNLQDLKSGKFVEPDLKQLKEQVLNMDVEDNSNIKQQVQMFRSYKRGGDSLLELQDAVNKFLVDTKYNVIDVKFSVQKNFLLGSTSGEFEEDSYAMVRYEI